jgi:3-hydroxyacyl-CoA dehydrogenase/enoyl-CoA hydratase/3-hydroxybutyryl-CoA epimerase
MSHGFKRTGRASGGGFYNYEDGEPPELWSGLKTFERRTQKVSELDVRDRLLYVQALEAMRCLQDDHSIDVGSLNRESISHGDFPASTGGVVSFIDQIGVARFVDRSRELASLYGARFEPCELLLSHARQGTTP